MFGILIKYLALRFLPKRKAFEDLDIFALAVPRRIAGKQDPPCTVVAENDLPTLVGIQAQHCRRVHPNRLADKLLQHLIGHIVAAEVREDQLVLDQSPQLLQHVQDHIRCAVHVVAEGDVVSGVGHDKQIALCGFAHNAQVARIVKMHALIVGMELDAEQTACLYPVERSLHIR